MRNLGHGSQVGPYGVGAKAVMPPGPPSGPQPFAPPVVTPPPVGNPPYVSTPPPVVSPPVVTPPPRDDYREPEEGEEPACQAWIDTDRDSYEVGEKLVITFQICETSSVSLIDHTSDGRSQMMSLGVLGPGTHSMTGTITEPIGTERIDLQLTSPSGRVTVPATTTFRVTEGTAEGAIGEVGNIIIPNEIRGCVGQLGYDVAREAWEEGWTYPVSADCTDCCLQCFESQLTGWVESQSATLTQSMCARQVWDYYQQASYEVKQEIARIYAEMFWEGY